MSSSYLVWWSAITALNFLISDFATMDITKLQLKNSWLKNEIFNPLLEEFIVHGQKGWD